MPRHYSPRDSPLFNSPHLRPASSASSDGGGLCFAIGDLTSHTRVVLHSLERQVGDTEAKVKKLRETLVREEKEKKAKLQKERGFTEAADGKDTKEAGNEGIMSNLDILGDQVSESFLEAYHFLQDISDLNQLITQQSHLIRKQLEPLRILSRLAEAHERMAADLKHIFDGPEPRERKENVRPSGSRTSSGSAGSSRRGVNMARRMEELSLEEGQRENTADHIHDDGSPNAAEEYDGGEDSDSTIRSPGSSKSSSTNVDPFTLGFPMIPLGSRDEDESTDDETESPSRRFQRELALQTRFFSFASEGDDDESLDL